jgi:hypothetical protein
MVLKVESLESSSEIMESSEKWGWKRMEKISWTDSVTMEEVLYRVKGEMNILHTVK